MKKTVIKVLAPHSYRSFKGWITETDNVNPVFVASFTHPLEHTPIDMYAKLYSLQPNNRSIFNEIVGYLMADALNLPQPKYACIALIPTEKLKQNIDCNFTDANLEKEIFSNSYYPVFCSSKIDPSETAFQYYGGVIETVVSELSKWSDYGKAMAMDNTICHADRHLNNILRTGTNKYHLIDNGILVSHNGWSTSDLNPTSQFRNVLLEITSGYMTNKQCKSIKGQAIIACDEHEDAFNKIKDELNYWLNSLYGPHQNDYNNFVHFLAQRVQDAPGILTSKLQMLI